MSVHKVSMLLLLVVMKWVHASINLFQPNANNVAQGNSVDGRIYYNNDTRYIATCGWEVVLSCANTLLDVRMYDATSEKVDNHTFILKSNLDKGRTAGLVSDITVNGIFNNQFPSILITWFCVCNFSTEPECKAVGCETIGPTMDALVARCVQVSGTAITTVGTTRPPNANLENLPLSSNLSHCSKVLERKDDSCYTGKNYTALTNVHHFIDCCSICCAYQTCEGVNFHQGANECDIIVIMIEGNSSLLIPVQDCMFWKVSYQSH